MKKNTLTLGSLALLIAAAFYLIPSEKSLVYIDAEDLESGKMMPGDWMYSQRAYPHYKIDKQAYKDAIRQTSLAKEEARTRGAGEWEAAGPVNIGGRITDVALHPANQSIIYAGTGAGGIFKTTDGGNTWSPIFDDFAALSIGDITLAPSAPNTLYAGTGEANGAFDSGALFGDGVYKSTNAGASWTHIGLEHTNHIGRIAIDPQNADRVYVAAAGVLYGKNEERGLYRTLNGGQTWDKVLYISDSTACIDVVVNPLNADIVYAATWERIRYPWQRQYGGVTSRIYRSLNGGNNWEQLVNGLPQNLEKRGRIGLAISASSPNILYASFTTNPVTNAFDGIYKSVDAGSSWTKVDDGSINSVFSSFGWFFGNVRVAPDDPNEVWCLGVPVYKSTNGGVSWTNSGGTMHVDHHALEFHPQNPDFMVAGNDGGLYISQNGGTSWQHINKLPVTMFYNGEIDFQQPQRLYGGTQDNGTMRTLTGGMDDWSTILGGDGFHVIVDPADNNYVYAEFQFGNFYRSVNGGNTMNFSFNGGLNDRTNWNTPVVMDPSNPATLYYGSNFLYKSSDRGVTWNVISPDLTKGMHPSGSTSFGTITSIAVAPSNPQTIYTGSDDGTMQVTFNGGGGWTNISAGIPDRFVTEIAVHPNEALTAFVTLSGFRNVDYQPHILRTTNGGASWEDVSGNLPEIPINDVVINPEFPSVLFIANDLGVWYTLDTGVTWEILGTNLPMTVVNDLILHYPTRTLVAATYGRSMLKFDVTEIVPPSTATGEQAFAANLLSVFPNPVSDITTISFSITGLHAGKLEVFSIDGKHIATLANQVFSQGENRITWKTAGLPEGIYIVRLQVKEKVWTKKTVKL